MGRTLAEAPTEIVEELYRCRCDRVEEYRAIDNVPVRAHFCLYCVPYWLGDHLVKVVTNASQNIAR